MRYERIQMLRFLAALAVVLLHAQNTALTYLPGAQRFDLLSHGGYGVDLFFVISGFIIRMTMEREPGAALFLRRRIERVAPLYWLCTVGLAALLMIGGVAREAGDAGSVLPRLGKSLGFLSWADGSGAYPLLYLGWSLEYEMLFYLVSAALLLWARRPVLPLAILLGGSVLIGGLTGAETGSPAAYFLGNPLLLEFLFGLLLAELLLGGRPWLAGAVTLAVLVIAVPLTGWGWRIWFIGLPGAALVGLAAWLDQRQVRLAWPTRFLARLGDASYSLYLVQAFTISAVCKLAVRIAPDLPLAALIVIITLVTVAAGYALFVLVERPLQRFTHRFGGHAPPERKRPAAQEAWRAVICSAGEGGL